MMRNNISQAEQKRLYHVFLLKQSIWFLFISVIITSIFTLYPQIDLDIAEFFYHRYGLIWGSELLPSIDSIIYGLGYILIVILFAVFIYAVLIRDISTTARYFLCCLYIGTVGLLGGIVFIKGSKIMFGRARPLDLTIFGGDKSFSSAWEISNQCLSDCSFMSGHGAIGFVLYSLIFLFPRYWLRIFIVSSFIGTCSGLTRMIVGKHFVSDVISSALVIYGTAIAVAWLFHLLNLRRLIEKHLITIKAIFQRYD